MFAHILTKGLPTMVFSRLDSKHGMSSIPSCAVGGVLGKELILTDLPYVLEVEYSFPVFVFCPFLFMFLPYLY